MSYSGQFKIPGLRRAVHEPTEEEIADFPQPPGRKPLFGVPVMISGDAGVIRRPKKQIYSDSSFYYDKNKKFPTMQEEMGMAKLLATSLASKANVNTKGYQMFMHRLTRAPNWETASLTGARQPDEYDMPDSKSKRWDQDAHDYDKENHPFDNHHQQDHYSEPDHHHQQHQPQHYEPPQRWPTPPHPPHPPHQASYQTQTLPGRSSAPGGHTGGGGHSRGFSTPLDRFISKNRQTSEPDEFNNNRGSMSESYHSDFSSGPPPGTAPPPPPSHGYGASGSVAVNRSSSYKLARPKEFKAKIEFAPVDYHFTEPSIDTSSILPSATAPSMGAGGNKKPYSGMSLASAIGGGGVPKWKQNQRALRPTGASASDGPSDLTLGEFEKLRLTQNRCFHDQVSPELAFSISDDLKNSRSKAAQKFAQRRARSDQYITDEDSVRQPGHLHELARTIYGQEQQPGTGPQPLFGRPQQHGMFKRPSQYASNIVSAPPPAPSTGASSRGGRQQARTKLDEKINRNRSMSPYVGSHHHHQQQGGGNGYSAPTQEGDYQGYNNYGSYGGGSAAAAAADSGGGMYGGVDTDF